MSWFDRILRPSLEHSKAPEGLWIKCGGCSEVTLKRVLEEHHNVCPKCGAHSRLGCRQWVALLLDAATHEETSPALRSTDPLGFSDQKPYAARIAEAERKSGLLSAVLTGTGTVEGNPVALSVMDFAFMGGSMDSVVGEKVARVIELATERRLPVIHVTASGGARMQEGILSLMQMAKTSAAMARHREAGLLSISVLSDPTTGGTTASFATLSDILLAEPGALIGFAGPRVIEQTIRQKLPDGFQRAEYLLEHGMIDAVVERRALKAFVGGLLRHYAAPACGRAGEGAA